MGIEKSSATPVIDKVLKDNILKFFKLKNKVKKDHGTLREKILSLASHDVLITSPVQAWVDAQQESHEQPSEPTPPKRKRKAFKDYVRTSKKSFTSDLLKSLQKFIDEEFPELTMNQLLGYLLCICNKYTYNANKAVSNIGLR